MNNPEYILTEVLAEVVAAVKTAMALEVLNYQYGFVRELNATLKQWSADTEQAVKKYPLVWFREPFTVIRNKGGFYGRVPNLELFVINKTRPEWKSAQRMENNFKPVLLPIARMLETKIRDSGKVSIDGQFKTSNHYFWGEEQQKVLSDNVDCLHISELELIIYNNNNC